MSTQPYWRTATAMAVLLNTALCASPVFADVFPEVEPNDRRTDANPITLQCGDAITGISTGSSQFPLTGTATADYFRIAVPASPGLIRRYTLTIPPPVFGLSLHGHPASDPNGDTLLQSAIATANGGRLVAWYGVGQGSLDQMFARVTGSPGTPDPYTATLACTPVAPVLLPEILSAGRIRIAGVQGERLVLFDPLLNSHPGWTSTSLDLNFSAGQFLLAVSPSVVYSPGSTPARTGLPGVVVPSIPVQSGIVRAVFRDQSNLPVQAEIPLDSQSAVGWVRFHVAGSGPGACCLGAGCTAGMTAESCAAAGGTFLGGSVPCILDYCPRACCYGDGDCRFIPPNRCSDSGGISAPLGMTCATAGCPAPLGAGCLNPIPIILPAQLPYIDSRTTCEMSTTLTCPTSAQDVIYRLHITEPICLRIVATGPGAAPWLSEEAGCPPCGTSSVAGVIDPLSLAPGTHFLAVRASPCGPYELQITACTPRACCFIDGSCQELLPADCALALGNRAAPGTNCTPNVCPPAVTCCIPDGACHEITAQACLAAGGRVYSDTADCMLNPCDEIRACCLPDARCIVDTIAQCLARYGQVQRVGTDCPTSCLARCLPGDVNCDGVVNNFDIDQWIIVRLHGDVPGLMWTGTAECWAIRNCTADINRDGNANGFDTDPFVNCIINWPPLGDPCPGP
ncbi:MAG: hypothetical protein IPM64_01190 [Phycisphaerales bacterium]|nr:hypothetical protein [Phycisphaerales bacterium]